LASLVEIEKQGLVEKLVAHPAVKGFDVADLHRFARCDIMPLDPMLFPPTPHRFEVSSVPLSDTIICGVPRLSIKAVSSRATR
jgi:hypothetical protein